MVGRAVVAALERGGHEAVVVSRAVGVDVLTGDGLAEAFAGADAAIDVLNALRMDPGGPREFFTAATANLDEAERAAGVRHHVVPSIVGERIHENPHYAGKQAQEEAALAGPVPATIVRATPFHDFAAMVVSWTAADGAATVPPLLVQPIAVDDVAEALVEAAPGPPRGRSIDIAGPEPQDLVDMARRTLAAHGQEMRLVPAWGGPFGTEMAGDVLLPGPDAHTSPTTFEAWLATQ